MDKVLGWRLLVSLAAGCDSGGPSPPIDAGDAGDGDIADDAGGFWGDGPVDVRFPEGFLWGTASSAYQVEGAAAADGGTAASNWSDWEAADRIRGGQRSGRGAGFREMYEEDLDRAVGLGSNAIRIGIEWARIEPQDDVWDEAELEHYAAVVRAARTRGLQVMVTLYHWVVPQWIQHPSARPPVDLLASDSDAFETAFEDFARRVAGRLAADVDLWVPLNEPFSVLSAGYLNAEHPPGGVLDMEGAQKAAVRFIFGHARAARAIREADTLDTDGDGSPALVGNAAVASTFHPKNPDDPQDVFAAGRISYIVNDVFIEAWTSGRLDVDMDGDFDDAGTVPPEGTYADLAGTLDWIGVNFYGPARVEAGVFAGAAPLHGMPLLDVDRYDPLLPHNEMGREISAPDFLETLRLYDRWGLPLYVTENGISDSGDTQRPFYLLEHVRVVGRAIAEGIDVRGYLHWSLTDNFEWSYGFTERFGLFRVDFGDPALPRTENASARLYREIATRGGIDQALWDEWKLDRYPTDRRP